MKKKLTLTEEVNQMRRILGFSSINENRFGDFNDKKDLFNDQTNQCVIKIMRRDSRISPYRYEITCPGGFRDIKNDMDAALKTATKWIEANISPKDPIQIRVDDEDDESHFYDRKGDPVNSYGFEGIDEDADKSMSDEELEDLANRLKDNPNAYEDDLDNLDDDDYEITEPKMNFDDELENLPSYLRDNPNAYTEEEEYNELDNDIVEPNPDEDCFLTIYPMGKYHVECATNDLGEFDDMEYALGAIDDWMIENTSWPRIWRIVDNMGAQKINQIDLSGDVID